MWSENRLRLLAAAKGDIMAMPDEYPKSRRSVALSLSSAMRESLL